MPDVYNLFWVYQAPNRPSNQIPVAQDDVREGQAVNRLDRSNVQDIPAVIFYPFLCTPDMMLATDNLELILLTKEGHRPRTANVNRQLKICEDFDPMKPYIPGPMLTGNDINDIKIKDLGELSDEQVYRSGPNQDGRFRGRVDPRAVALYKRRGFKKVWAVTVPAKALEIVDSQDNPVELHRKVNERITLRDNRQNFNNEDWIIIKEFVRGFEGNRNRPRYKNDLRYGFKIDNIAKDVTIGDIDGDNPLQAYHPVFVYDQLEYANVTHMADIHLCGRQQLITQNPVRVIEHDAAPGQPRPAHFMNICSERAYELFEEFRTNQDMHVMVIGGDLIDYVPQIYEDDFHTWKTQQSTLQIWDLLNVTNNNCKNDNIDNLSIFALIIDSYIWAKKPIYAVTGNHDAYRHSFGIAPTVAGNKTNKDIAADHNLTWYESVLVFGEYYHKMNKSTGTPLATADWKWFYTLFTPWADFSVELPKQIILALGWGDDESLLISKGQGFGHLPRADKALTNTTWDLVRGVADYNRGLNANKKKIILTTHFTFVSYSPDSLPSDVSNNPADWEGQPWTGEVNHKEEKFSSHDNGTFHLLRKEMYEDTLLDPDVNVQMVLTGHSHRRGIYRFRPVRDVNQNITQLKTNIYDVRLHANGVPPDQADEIGPYVILSDSGGPHPNHNQSQELNGVGRDKPGGTLIRFDPANGNIQQIEVIETTMDPRFAVSIDYMDLCDPLDLGRELQEVPGRIYGTNMVRPKVIQGFETDFFDINANQCTFTLDLYDDILNTWHVNIEAVELYFVHYSRSRNQWTRHRYALQQGADNTQWIMTRNTDIEAQFTNNSNRATFALIKFDRDPNCTLHDRYDFDDPWTFEVAISSEVQKEKTGMFRSRIARKKFIVDRYKSDYRFYPSFKIRKRYPEYAVVPGG